MNPENILTTEETSQKLYDLGFRKESCFYWNGNVIWYVFKNENDIIEGIRLQKAGALPINGQVSWLIGIIDYLIPAHTFQSLLDVLPKKLFVDGIEYFLCMDTGLNLGYFSEDTEFDGSDELHCEINDNKAEAAGQLLIWCIKQGYYKCPK